jgi:hypothetical protein
MLAYHHQKMGAQISGRGFGHWFKHAMHKAGDFAKANLEPLAKEALSSAAQAGINSLASGGGGSLKDNLRRAAMSAGQAGVGTAKAGAKKQALGALGALGVTTGAGLRHTKHHKKHHMRPF